MSRRLLHLCRHTALHQRASFTLPCGPARGVMLAATRGTTSTASSAAHWVHTYGVLSKFKLSGFVVSTACAGFVLASRETIAWDGLVWAAAGTWGAAACANTLNQVAESKTDGLMQRTRFRPLPAGLMSRTHALLFAAATGCSGLAALAVHSSVLSAALGGATIVLYAGIYTPLKRLSVANTWVGALVGALPPAIGWAAATGGTLSAGAAVLPVLLYCWQLPHFMALAYMHRADYAAGGYRMLPLVDPSGRRTAAVALRNALALVPVGFAAGALGVVTPPFAWEALVLSGALAAGAALFWVQPTQSTARRLFLLSLVHLPVLQAASVLHRIPNTDVARNEKDADMLSWFARQRADLAVLFSEKQQHGLFAVPFPFLPLPPWLPVVCQAQAQDHCSGAQGQEHYSRDESSS